MKKSIKALVSIVAAVAILAAACLSITGVSAAEYRLGDVDMNGQVNAEDARLALRIAAKLDTASALQNKLADIDGDGSVNAEDARAILRFAAKLDEAPDTLISDDGTTESYVFPTSTDESTTVPTTAEPTTAEPTSEPTTAEPTPVEPTSETPSKPVVPEYDVGVDRSLAVLSKPEVFYIKATLTEETGGTPVEIATDGSSTYMHTKGDVAGNGTVVDIGVLNKSESGLIKTGNGLYLINYEKSKYLYMPESIIRMAGIDPAEFSESLGTDMVDIPKFANVADLKPITNDDGTVTVRLHESESVYADYVFASASDNVPVKVTHYVGEKVVSTLTVESYTEDAASVKAYLSAPAGLTEVKLSLFNIEEMMEFMEELGMA